MITLTIPDGPTLELHHLVLDMNGTLATDGHVRETTLERLRKLATQLDIYVITSDTFGTARRIFEHMPIEVITLEGSATRQKRDFVRELGPQSCVAIGNGNNDVAMLETARLSVCVIGREGAAMKTIQAADVVVTTTEDAIDLLLFQDRLRATLRG